MSSIRALIRFARKVVENVLSQLNQLLQQVENEARRPMQMMVQQVVGGVWTGRGADAFVEEVSSLMIPGVGQVMDMMGTYSGNIRHAIDVIDRADEQVNSAVNGLADQFANIY